MTPKHRLPNCLTRTRESLSKLQGLSQSLAKTWLDLMFSPRFLPRPLLLENNLSDPSPPLHPSGIQSVPLSGYLVDQALNRKTPRGPSSTLLSTKESTRRPRFVASLLG